MGKTSIKAVGMGLMALSVLGVGCTSTKHATAVHNRTDAVNALGDMRTDLQKADAQVRTTQMALHDLVDQQSGDLRPSYNTFSSNVDKTIAMNEQIQSRNNAVTNTAFEYLNGWNFQPQSIYDQQVRQDSITHQQQSMKQYTGLLSTTSEVQTAFSMYCQQLQDWRSYCASNLTGDGMKRLQAQTARIDDSAKSLRQRLGTLDSRANQLASSWESYIAPKMTTQPPAGAQPAGSSISPLNESDVNNAAPAKDASEVRPYENRNPGDKPKSTP